MSLKISFLICVCAFLTFAQENNYRRIEQQPAIENFPTEKNFRVNKVNTDSGVWTELNPKVPRVTYYGLNFINPDTGWACGVNGAIIKTINGGEDWTISETPVNEILLKIHSYNGQVVIATGTDGIILRSGNGGETFEQVTSGVGSGTHLWGVQMLNDTLGWICGMNQTLLKTTDAGLNWQQVFPGLNEHYWALEFLTEQYGFIACEGGRVLKTTDGGNNWTAIQAGDTRALYTVDIIDSLHIAAAGEWRMEIQYDGGKNVYSSDGGVSWTINPDLITGSDANWIEFVDRDTGYCVSLDKGLFKTTNRGESWFNPNQENRDGYWHIELLEDGTGYYGGEGLNIYKRTDGIDNWEKIFLNYNWSDVFFVNEMRGFFISNDLFGGGLYKTEDGGLTYQRVENAPKGGDLLFLDSLIGFIGSNLIYKTTDGGESWYETNGGGGKKVFFINNTTGWSIDSHIYKTTDGGENWFTQVGVDNFESIFFIDTLNGWAASRHIWQTTDGGSTWEQRIDIIPSTVFFDDVYFTSSDTGWIAAYTTINPSLFKTTNAGLDWTPIYEIVGARKFYFFPDLSHWFIIGWSRYYETIDGGNTWIEFTDDIPAGITSFHSKTNTFGYAVGSGGLILRYEDTTYVPVELVSFTGKTENDIVILEWITASELNNYGFEIQILIDNNQWRKVGFVPGKGTSTETNHYSFLDPISYDGEVKYRLKQIDYDGTYIYSQIINILIEGSPLYFILSQNFPNPFNSLTIITYQIPTDEFVTLKVYDVLGNEVSTLVNANQEAGNYSAKFNASHLPSGIYFYRIESDSFSSTKKLILLK